MHAGSLMLTLQAHATIALCRRIGDFEIYLSADGDTFPDTPVATGTWGDTPGAKTRSFDAADAQALRLVALSAAPTGQVWASAGDIQVLSALL